MASKRKRFTLKEKIEILEFRTSNINMSVRALADKFSVSKTQIADIIVNKDALYKTLAENGEEKRKWTKLQKTETSVVDNEVDFWNIDQQLTFLFVLQSTRFNLKIGVLEYRPAAYVRVSFAVNTLQSQNWSFGISTSSLRSCQYCCPHWFQSIISMASRPNQNQASSSRNKYNQKNTSKQQVEFVTVEKHKVQYAKPTALVSPQKRSDKKPMFPKPCSRQD